MARHYGKRGMVRASKPRYVWVPAQTTEAGVTSGVTSSADLLAAYVSDAAREIGPGFVIERVIRYS